MHGLSHFIRLISKYFTLTKYFIYNKENLPLFSSNSDVKDINDFSLYFVYSSILRKSKNTDVLLRTYVDTNLKKNYDINIINTQIFFCLISDSIKKF